MQESTGNTQPTQNSNPLDADVFAPDDIGYWSDSLLVQQVPEKQSELRLLDMRNFDAKVSAEEKAVENTVVPLAAGFTIGGLGVMGTVALEILAVNDSAPQLSTLASGAIALGGLTTGLLALKSRKKHRANIKTLAKEWLKHSGE